MERAARAARFGSRILSVLAILLALLMLLYGSFSLWDNWVINNKALESQFLKFKPTREHKDSLYDLIRINDDVRGWLTIDKTHMDYPLIQGSYDYEYLNKNAYGDYVLSGSIFMSTTNAGDFSDPYTLIYGHHMDNGAMFGDIDRFLDWDFFNQNQTGTLYLPDKTYAIQIFACIPADAYDSRFYSEKAQTTDDLPGFVDYICHHAGRVTEDLSGCFRDLNIRNGDHIIGLSTCADAVTNGRYILFGKLVEKEFESQGSEKDPHGSGHRESCLSQDE